MKALKGRQHAARRNPLPVDHAEPCSHEGITLFADSKQQLHTWREEIAAWLRVNRGLAVHTERAHPRPCRGRHRYLGHTVTRSGIRPGPRLERRMRERLPLHLRGDLVRLQRSLAAYRGAYLL